MPNGYRFSSQSGQGTPVVRRQGAGAASLFQTALFALAFGFAAALVLGLVP